MIMLCHSEKRKTEEFLNIRFIELRYRTNPCGKILIETYN